MNKTELEHFLQEQIPLSISMGLELRSVSKDKVVLWAPLAPNRNHLGTAFGGSLQGLLIFSCYTWLFNFLSTNGPCHVLIQEAHTSYIHPVTSDMEIVCECPSLEEIEKFMKVYERRGKARIELRSYVETNNKKTCIFKGDFVAEKSSSSAIK